jgi:hypothetical protein
MDASWARSPQRPFSLVISGAIEPSTISGIPPFYLIAHGSVEQVKQKQKPPHKTPSKDIFHGGIPFSLPSPHLQGDCHLTCLPPDRRRIGSPQRHLQSPQVNTHEGVCQRVIAAFAAGCV